MQRLILTFATTAWLVVSLMLMPQTIGIAQEQDPKAKTEAVLKEVIEDGVDYKDANVREVIDSLFKDTDISGLEVDPQVQGVVTIRIRGVSRETILNRVTKQVKATWRVDEDGVLHVLPLAKAGGEGKTTRQAEESGGLRAPEAQRPPPRFAENVRQLARQQGGQPSFQSPPTSQEEDEVEERMVWAQIKTKFADVREFIQLGLPMVVWQTIGDAMMGGGGGGLGGGFGGGGFGGGLGGGFGGFGGGLGGGGFGGGGFGGGRFGGGRGGGFGGGRRGF